MKTQEHDRDELTQDEMQAITGGLAFQQGSLDDGQGGGGPSVDQTDEVLNEGGTIYVDWRRSTGTPGGIDQA